MTLAAAGAAVVINAGRNRQAIDGVAAEIAARGGPALPVLADVAGPAAVDGLVATAVERFGRLDILDTNAAARPEQALAAMTLADWHGVGPSLWSGPRSNICRRAAPGPSSISVASMTTPARQRAHVVTAKAGLVGLTRALAHELAADNITAAFVSGLIDTEREQKSSLAAAPPGQPHAARPLGSAEAIAAAVCFLCGPSARYCTGQTLHVNGGVSAAGRRDGERVATLSPRWHDGNGRARPGAGRCGGGPSRRPRRSRCGAIGVLVVGALAARHAGWTLQP